MIYDILPVNNYCGNNSSTTFDFDFYIDSENQLKVSYYNEDEIQTELELNVDYTINEIKNENGSYITFPIDGSKYSVLGENEKISLELTLPISQETQYNNSSLLNLEALEYSFDYLTRLIQIISRKIELCIKVEECSSTTPEGLLELINNQALYAKASADEAINALTQLNTKYSELLEIYSDINSNYEKFNKIDDIEKALDLFDSKADLDLSNLTNEGQIKAAHLAMPSDTYIDLTPSTSTTYTAPADGIFCLRVINVSSGSNAGISTATMTTNSTAYPSNASYVLVAKGDTVTLTKESGSFNYFRFIFAQGAVSEAES